MDAMAGFIALPRPPLRLIAVAALHGALILIINEALRVDPGVRVETPLRVVRLPEELVRPLPADPPREPLVPVGIDRIADPPPVPDAIPEAPDEVATADLIARDRRTVVERTAPVPVTPVRADPRHPLTQPEYPVASIRFGEEGVVELAIYVGVDGRIGEVRITKGSGHRRLDEAAVEEARRRWRLLPASRGGEPSPGWGHFRVVFRIDKR